MEKDANNLRSGSDSLQNDHGRFARAIGSLGRIMRHGFVAASVVTLLGLAGVGSAQEALVKAGGTMTSVESGGIVKIDERMYEVPYSARVQNWKEQYVSLQSFTLPTRVYFEYERTGGHNVIHLIREIP